MTRQISGDLRLYLRRHADSLWEYVLEQGLQSLLGWIPTPVGIGLRGIFYRLFLRMEGWAAIEDQVRLSFGRHITLGHRVYLDRHVYLHACPQGIQIGPGTLVMYGAVLHVYNFRQLPHAFIRIGQDSLIGEYAVIRGQGGVTIGDRVYVSPHVQILAVNHIFDDPAHPFVDQGITAEGITIEDDVWIGSGAIITDGVRIGKGAVVGAGAVVTEDVSPHTVVGGIPARLLRIIDGKTTSARGKVVYVG